MFAKGSAVLRASLDRTGRARGHVRRYIWQSKGMRRRIAQGLSTIVVATGAAVVMVPVIWMLSTSLKQQANVVAFPPQWIPVEAQRLRVGDEYLFLYDVSLATETRVLAAKKLDPERSVFVDPADPSHEYYAPASQARKHQTVRLHWENYREAWTYASTPFAVYMRNTIRYVLIAVTAEVLSSAIAAYGFARLRAPDKNLLFMILMGTMMLPWAVTMIPSYVLFTRYIPNIIDHLFGVPIQVIDSWWPLLVPKFFADAHSTFLIRQFYMSIPKDYDDAARIDGCSHFQTWIRVIMPMSRPVLIAVAILSLMYHWNDYMGPLIYLNSTTKLPLSVGLASFQVSHGGTPWHLMMAASMIAVLPVVLVFFVLNRYFVQGIVVSGIKG